MDNIKTIDSLDTSPFKRLVLSFGGVPADFKESMTYYELLAWLCNYLEKEVLPKVNETIDKYDELITAYNTLKDYVDNYFANLDVQEEINHKLDDMAEAGTLAEIISIYLNSNAIMSFDDVADLASATNLVAGSFAKTYGKDSFNDNYGAFYKIREKTESDVADGYTIVDITGGELVAEIVLNITDITSLISISKYDNEAALIADTTLTAGRLVKTLGKTTVNDGEGAYYLINTITGDITLSNGLYASLINDFESNYYDEVSIKSGNVNVTGTSLNKATYYIASIPKFDKFGNPITLHVVENENLKPSEYAEKYNTTFTSNASLAFQPTGSGDFVDGIAIGDGEVLNDYTGTYPADYGAYLGIKDNNVVTLYPKTTTAATMLADGVEQAIFCFGAIVINGAVNESAYGIDAGTMSLALGQKADGSFIIFGNDGRCYDSQGLTVREVANIMISEGCVNAWELDGGGSISMNYHGTRINQLYDEGRTHERTIGYLFNVQHTTKNKEVANIASTEGEITRIKEKRLQQQFQRYEYRHSYLKGNIRNTVLTDGAGTQIYFDLSAPSDPNVIPLIKENAADSYYKGFKFWRKGVARISYTLQIENPTGNTLNFYVDLMNGDSAEYTTSIRIPANSWMPVSLNYLGQYFQTYDNTQYLRFRGNGGVGEAYIPRGTLNIEYIPTDQSY